MRALPSGNLLRRGRLHMYQLRYRQLRHGGSHRLQRVLVLTGRAHFRFVLIRPRYQRHLRHTPMVSEAAMSTSGQVLLGIRAKQE